MKLLKSCFNICGLYILIWCLYAFHWNEIFVGSIIDRISVLFLGFNILVSIICMSKIQTDISLNLFLRWIKVLLLLFCIYGGLYLIMGKQSDMLVAMGVSPVSYIVGPLRSFLPVFAFYYFAKEGKLTEDMVKLCFFVLLMLYGAFSFIKTELMMSDVTRIGFTNNMGYLFVALIPYVYVFRKSIIQYVSLAVVMLFILKAMKRGAILVAVIIACMFMWTKYKESRKSERAWIIIISVLFVLAAAYYIMTVMMNDAYFQYRIQATLEGDSSGRDEIIDSLRLYLANEASVFELLFGSGADATVSIAGNYAHNDWYEVLINQGVFGLIVYITYWYQSYRYTRRCHGYEKSMILSFVLTYFLCCFFSMSYSCIPLAATLLLGYNLAKQDYPDIN